MARTVKKIIEEDKEKADLGVDMPIEDDIVDETAAAGDQSPTPEETAEDLRQQLKEANERTARETERRREAEEAAAKASTTAGTAVQSQIATHETAIAGKITTAKTNLEAIKQQLKQAKTAQDSDAEVDLQDALTNARYELNTAEWEQKQFTTWKEAQNKAPVTAASPYTVREQAWIDSHPEFNTNKRFSRTAKLAAQDALDEGHKQDSEGYINYIESALREEGLLKAVAEPLSGAGDNTTASMAAAPNRTGNGSAAVASKNSKYPFLSPGFRIPPDWVQASEDQGFEDPREYANMRLEEEAKASSGRA